MGADTVLATAADTPLDTLDSATLVATTASVRLRPRLMLMLRLIPTTDSDTPALATLDSDTAVATTEESATATAVATDTSDKKVPELQSAKAFKTSVKQNNFS